LLTVAQVRSFKDDELRRHWSRLKHLHDFEKTAPTREAADWHERRATESRIKHLQAALADVAGEFKRRDLTPETPTAVEAKASPYPVKKTAEVTKWRAEVERPRAAGGVRKPPQTSTHSRPKRAIKRGKERKAKRSQPTMLFRSDLRSEISAILRKYPDAKSPEVMRFLDTRGKIAVPSRLQTSPSDRTFQSAYKRHSRAFISEVSKVRVAMYGRKTQKS
jgi:hypothetical protein